MQIKKLTVTDDDFPEVLRTIPGAPKQLFHVGAALGPLLERPRVAIVGSRSVSPYGRQVTTKLAGQLAEQGIVIVSGLALGVDGLAHQAAVEAGGRAIAVLPGPLEHIVPTTNRRLGQAILDTGGALVSEYEAGMPAMRQNFVARNRLVAGLAQAVLITEAAEKSGSLHTANFALDQGKDVLAVPGAITSRGSVGVNNLIKTGATPITSYIDVLRALGLDDQQIAAQAVRGRNANEQLLLDLLQRGLSSGDQLLQTSKLSTSHFNQALTMLEIGGKIRPLGANNWAIA